MAMCSVSDADLEAIVQRAVNSKERATIRSHHVESLSGKGPGIMANHFILLVQVELEGGECRKVQFFVKTPPDSSALRDSVVDEWVSFEEVHFFEKLYPALMQHYKGRSWCPACYLAKSELLVFQDLRPEGFCIRRDGIFDEASLESALETLARFHASSIIAEASVFDNKPLDQVYPQAFKEKIFTDVGKGGRANKLAFRTMRLLADKFNLDDAALLPDILQRLHQLVKPVQGGCNVICHGDLWRSNIMFEDADKQCILVDYQMLRYGSPSLDLAMLLCVHTRPEFRASFEPPMLRHYYSTFRATLEACSAVSELRIPDYAPFLRDYELRKLVGLAYACTRWPKIVFQHVIHDPVALQRWYFETRIDIYEKAIGEDPNYARITRDCLRELLQEGKRVLNL